MVGRLRLEKAVPFGQPAAGFLPTEEELVSALRPVVGWTPSPDLPLFQDTTFEPIYQDTEEPVCSAGAGADNRFAERRPLE